MDYENTQNLRDTVCRLGDDETKLITSLIALAGQNNDAAATTTIAQQLLSVRQQRQEALNSLIGNYHRHARFLHPEICRPRSICIVLRMCSNTLLPSNDAADSSQQRSGLLPLSRVSRLMASASAPISTDTSYKRIKFAVGTLAQCCAIWRETLIVYADYPFWRTLLLDTNKTKLEFIPRPLQHVDWFVSNFREHCLPVVVAEAERVNTQIEAAIARSVELATDPQKQKEHHSSSVAPLRTQQNPVMWRAAMALHETRSPVPQYLLYALGNRNVASYANLLEIRKQICLTELAIDPHNAGALYCLFQDVQHRPHEKVAVNGELLLPIDIIAKSFEFNPNFWLTAAWCAIHVDQVPERNGRVIVGGDKTWTKLDLYVHACERGNPYFDAVARLMASKSPVTIAGKKYRRRGITLFPVGNNNDDGDGHGDDVEDE